MNIEQIKKDRDAGIIVSNTTWNALIEAALLMEHKLNRIASHELQPANIAQDTLRYVKEKM